MTTITAMITIDDWHKQVARCRPAGCWGQTYFILGTAKDRSAHKCPTSAGKRVDADRSRMFIPPNSSTSAPESIDNVSLTRSPSPFHCRSSTYSINTVFVIKYENNIVRNGVCRPAAMHSVKTLSSQRRVGVGEDGRMRTDAPEKEANNTKT